MMIRSLRWRLQIWHALVLVAVLGTFGGVVYYLHWQTRLQQVDAELDRTAQVLISRVRRLFPPPTWRPGSGSRTGMSPPRRSGEPDRRPRDDAIDDAPAIAEVPGDPPRPPRNWPRTPPGLGLPEDFAQLFEGPENTRLYFVIWDRDGDVLEKSTSAPEIEFPGLQPSQNDLPAQTVRSRDALREVVHASRFGTNVLVGRSMRGDLHAQRASGLALLGIGAGVLAAGLAGGWWFTARSIRPISAMAATAESISGNSLSKRIDVAETDSELGQLAEILNGMFDRLQAAFERQTRFTADASHELRTPLAVILSHTELALARSRSEAEYREALETCRRSSRRMKALIDKLLLLARYDGVDLAAATETVELDSLVTECVELVRPLASERQIRIDSQAAAANVCGDRERLSQAVTNLLSNAIRYNYDGGTIRVRVAVEDRAAVLSVADTGVGISAEHLPHIFERFYRVDKARSRADGGSGLGLAICRTIVESHGGTIRAESVLGEGSAFEIRLPLMERPSKSHENPNPGECHISEVSAF